MLDWIKYARSYRDSFAKAHGMSNIEAARLFRKYGVNGYIRCHYAVIGHRGAVSSIRSFIINRGGDLPDRID